MAEAVPYFYLYAFLLYFGLYSTLIGTALHSVHSAFIVLVVENCTACMVRALRFLCFFTSCLSIFHIMQCLLLVEPTTILVLQACLRRNVVCGTARPQANLPKITSHIHLHIAIETVSYSDEQRKHAFERIPFR